MLRGESFPSSLPLWAPSDITTLWFLSLSIVGVERWTRTPTTIAWNWGPTTTTWARRPAGEPSSPGVGRGWAGPATWRARTGLGPWTTKPPSCPWPTCNYCRRWSGCPVALDWSVTLWETRILSNNIGGTLKTIGGGYLGLTHKLLVRDLIFTHQNIRFFGVWN